MKEKIISVGVIAVLFFTIFTSPVAASSSGTVWYQDEGEAHIYDLNLVSPVASDTTHGQDNYLALSAEVFKVSGPDDIDHPSDYTMIDLTVGVFGNSEFYYQNSLTVDSLLWARPKAIEIEAILSEVPSHNAHIDWDTSYSGGVNVGGDETPTEDVDGYMENTIRESVTAVASEVPFVSWGITPLMLWGAVLEDLSDVKYIQDITGSQGSGALIRQGWDIPHPVLGDDEDLSEDLIYKEDLSFTGVEWYEGTMNFTASSKITIRIPATHTEELSVDISASILMENNNNGNYTDEWGAQTEDVTITIKNGEPSIISELSTDKAHYKTSDYGKGFVRPIFQNLMITNTAGSMDAKYYVTIEYNADWTNDWKTLTSDNDWITINQEFQKAFAINVPDGVKDQIVDIRYTVIAFDEYGGWVEGPYYIPSITVTDDLDTILSVSAQTKDATVNSYGDHTYVFTIGNAGDTDGSVSLTIDDTADWPVSVEPSSFYLYAGETQSVDVTVTIPDGVADGGYSDIKLTATASPISGGGCPYVSSWNGTDYQLDNNILIASEHQDGMVDDHYVLQNVVEPKDGYYSLKIEEFENSKDYFDTVKLYTIDHQEDYEIATTPDGEIIAYREPRPAVSAYNSEGEDVLEYLNNTDGEALFVEEGSSVFLNFGELSKSQWEHNKLVVQSHGFESYTDVPPDDSDPEYVLPIKTSLHVGVRMDGSEWKNVTILHPRNHPSAIVIPLNETLEGFVENKSGGSLGELEVKILGSDDHYIDFVGIDDSVPAEPTMVQEATLASALLNGEEDVTDLLSTNDTEMVTLIPGEHISLDFDIPKQSPAPVFGERSYMLFSRGYYELYESNNDAQYKVLAQTDTLLSNELEASDTMRVTFEHPGSNVEVNAPGDTTVNDYGTYGYTYTVENIGGFEDTYDLAVSDTEGWTVSAQSTVSLNPGQIKDVEVTVTIPTSATDGTSSITLTATSQHGGQTDSGVMKLSFYYQHPGSTVYVNAPADAKVTSTGTYRYYFSVTNTGSLNDVYDITVSNTKGWTDSAQSTVSLSAGQTKNIAVDITIPSSTSSGQYTDITLKTTSQNGGQSDSGVMRLTYVEPPSVEITSPADGEIIYTTYEPVTISVNWEGESGIDRYWIRLNGGSWIDVGTSTSYTLENLYYGSYTVTVRARKDGVYGYDSVSFTVQEIEDIL